MDDEFFIFHIQYDCHSEETKTNVKDTYTNSGFLSFSAISISSVFAYLLIDKNIIKAKKNKKEKKDISNK